MKPLIATTGAHIYSDDGYLQNLLWQVYMDGIIVGGGLPIMITNADDDDALQIASESDGLFLSGGMDVSPCIYGASPSLECGKTDYTRDLLELRLIRAFVQKQKPILGICRGFQMLNVFFGGTLYQDIFSETSYVHPYQSIHEVKVAKGSILEELFGSSFTVNSLHHQAIDSLGKNLIPIAFASNGPFIEAFYHDSLPIIAVQWHPERILVQYECRQTVLIWRLS